MGETDDERAEEIERIVNENNRLVAENNRKLREIEECLRDVSISIYGSDKINALGLMKRVSSIEDAIRRWQNLENMMKGALLIMALTSGINLFTALKTFGIIP